MVRSFLLNIQTTLDMKVNRKSTDHDVSASVRLLKGSVALLQSRMLVSLGENSYVNLFSSVWDQQGIADEPEMMMGVVMENDDLFVWIGEFWVSSLAGNHSCIEKTTSTISVRPIYGRRVVKCVSGSAER